MKEIVHTVFIESQDEVLVNTVWSTQLLTATCDVDVLGLVGKSLEFAFNLLPRCRAKWVLLNQNAGLIFSWSCSSKDANREYN